MPKRVAGRIRNRVVCLWPNIHGPLMPCLFQHSAQGGQGMIDGLHVTDAAEHSSSPQTNGIKLVVLRRSRDLVDVKREFGVLDAHHFILCPAGRPETYGRSLVDGTYELFRYFFALHHATNAIRQSATILSVSPKGAVRRESVTQRTG